MHHARILQTKQIMNQTAPQIFLDDFLKSVFAELRNRPRLLLLAFIGLFGLAGVSSVVVGEPREKDEINCFADRDRDLSRGLELLRSLDLDLLRSSLLSLILSRELLSPLLAKNSSGMPLSTCLDTSLLGRRPGGSEESADSLSPVLLPWSSREFLDFCRAPAELGSALCADACFFC